MATNLGWHTTQSLFFLKSSGYLVCTRTGAGMGTKFTPGLPVRASSSDLQTRTNRDVTLYWAGKPFMTSQKLREIASLVNFSVNFETIA